ncbi:MAG: acyltransferase family protein [Thermoanaerobaculia bacterium]
MTRKTSGPKRSRPRERPAPAEPRVQAAYRPELDVLRFFAFLAVFVHHSAVTVKADPKGALGAFVVAGAFGVDLFFVLSAFLITDLFLKEIGAFGNLNVPAFYVRRILRIWPLYLAFLVVAALVPDRPLRGEALVWFALFVGNWYLARYNYPDSIGDPLWSVSIEEQFYVTWPLLFTVVGVRRLVPLSFCLLATATATRAVLVSQGVVKPGIWCNSLARLDPIALGILLAAAQARIPRLGRRARAGLIALGIGGLWACGALNAFKGPGSLIMYPGVALSCFVILVAVLGWEPGSSRLARAVAYLGKISYGLYVFHVLALRLVHHVSPEWPVVFVLGLALTAGMGVLSYELYEKRFLRLKRRFTRVTNRPVD